MPSSTSNKSFADSFVARHRTNLFPEERVDVEKTLGKGAIKFKIAEGGIRAVFAAHKQADRSASPPKKVGE